MNAIYARVSTEDQARTGYSLEDQVQSCRKRLRSIGWDNVEEYVDDGYSGEFLERPALDRLREDLRAGSVQSVMVYDPDRLSRNLTNQLILADEIEKANAKLLFITGDYDASPEGRLFFSIRGAISAFEKAKIRERTLRGKRAKALSGKMIQKSFAYGYTWDEAASNYVICEEEAAIVRTIYDLYLSRRSSVKEVTVLLNHQGFRNRQGKPFTLTHVYRILSDEKYAGTKWSFNQYDKKISQYKRKKTKRNPEEWIPIAIPPIVSKEQFKEAKRLLKENKRKSPRNTVQEYLLRGYLRCTGCGYNVGAHCRLNKSGTHYKWYKCISGRTDKLMTPCGCKAISADYLDNLVWDQLIQTAGENKDIPSLFTIKAEPDHEKAIAELKQRQLELKKKKTTILKWFNQNLLASEDAETELSNILLKMEHINTKLSELAKQEASKTSVPAEDMLKAQPFEQRRAVIEALGWTYYLDNRGDKLKIKVKK